MCARAKRATTKNASPMRVQFKPLVLMPRQISAGYTEADILGFGDLAMFRSERMTELLHRKAVEAFGNALGKTLPKKDLKVKVIRGKKWRGSD